MPSLNRVMLMGNLTRDPELRYLPSNAAVASFSLAINRRWKNSQGEQQEETTFVECEIFNRSAEVVAQYAKKGHPIYVEGRLKLDQWQDKEGQTRSKLKMVVESFQFLATGEREQQAPQQRPQGYPSSGYRSGIQKPGRSSQPKHDVMNEEDIPF